MESEKNDNSKLGHVFDIAMRYRNAAASADRTLERPKFSCVLQGVLGNTTVMQEASFNPLITTWSPMFAPTSTPDPTAVVGGAGSVLQEVANAPWDPTNVGVRTKHLARYPCTVPNFVPRYIFLPSSKLVPTAIWASLPEDAAKPLDATLATYRAWQADVKLGMSMQNLAYLGTLTRDQHKTKSWNPTGWLMNIYTYLLSTDAVRYRNMDCIELWRTPVNHLVITNNDDIVVSARMDHIDNAPASLLANTVDDDAVAVGFLPIVSAGNRWEGEVEEADTADFGFLFHTRALNDPGGNPVAAPCYKGDAAGDTDIVFTTDLQAAVARHPYLSSYCMTSVPTAFLETASTLDQRARRIALWVLGICPCMATVTMSVTEVSGLGNQAEGLMYWNGGTLMSVPQRKMVVVVPMEVFANITNASQRLLSSVSFGPRDVVACRRFGLTDIYEAGEPIAGGQQILRDNIATEAVSMSAFISSWQNEFRARDWTWYLIWVRSHYHCENCLVDAIERVESQIGLLRPGIITDNLDDGIECYRSGMYEAALHDADDVVVNFRSPLWDLVVGCDCVIRTRTKPREHVIPMFFAELADKIAIGLYTLETKESTVALPVEYFGSDFNHLNALKWNVWCKHVKYDAVFTACGATESMLLRSNTSGFNRCRRTVLGDPAETRMRLPQDQWLTTADTLWSTLDQNDLKSGWQYMDFAATSELYVKHVGAKVPCESFLLKPTSTELPSVAAATANRTLMLDWHCFGGPYTAPGAPAWVPDAVPPQQYPNIRFRTDLLIGDYSLLFHYRFDVDRNLNNDKLCIPASLSAKGCYSWLMHNFFGRVIKPFSATLGGSPLPYDAPDRLIADSDHDTPYKWMGTAKDASGTSISGSYFDTTSWPYEFERDLGVMRQVGGFDAYIVSTNRDARAIYQPGQDFGERADVNSICILPFVAADLPVPGGSYDEAILNIFSRRIPRFTTDLRWLYLYSGEAEVRAWWAGEITHVGRHEPLEYVSLRMPSLLVTHRGRDRILVDMAAKCKPPAQEVHVERTGEGERQGKQQEPATRADKSEPVTRPVIVDTSGPDVSTTLDKAIEPAANSDE